MTVLNLVDDFRAGRFDVDLAYGSLTRIWPRFAPGGPGPGGGSETEFPFPNTPGPGSEVGGDGEWWDIIVEEPDPEDPDGWVDTGTPPQTHPGTGVPWIVDPVVDLGLTPGKPYRLNPRPVNTGGPVGPRQPGPPFVVSPDWAAPCGGVQLSPSVGDGVFADAVFQLPKLCNRPQLTIVDAVSGTVFKRGSGLSAPLNDVDGEWGLLSKANLTFAQPLIAGDLAAVAALTSSDPWSFTVDVKLYNQPTPAMTVLVIGDTVRLLLVGSGAGFRARVTSPRVSGGALLLEGTTEMALGEYATITVRIDPAGTMDLWVNGDLDDENTDGIPLNFAGWDSTLVVNGNSTMIARRVAGWDRLIDPTELVDGIRVVDYAAMSRSASNTTQTLAIPAGAKAKDVALVVCIYGSAAPAGSATPPAGWKLVGVSGACSSFYKLLDGTETAFTQVTDATTNMRILMSIIRGADQRQPAMVGGLIYGSQVGALVGSASPQTIDLPTIPKAKWAAVRMGIRLSSQTLTWQNPSGYQEVLNAPLTGDLAASNKMYIAETVDLQATTTAIQSLPNSSSQFWLGTNGQISGGVLFVFHEPHTPVSGPFLLGAGGNQIATGGVTLLAYDLAAGQRETWSRQLVDGDVIVLIMSGLSEATVPTIVDPSGVTRLGTHTPAVGAHTIAYSWVVDLTALSKTWTFASQSSRIHLNGMLVRGANPSSPVAAFDLDDGAIVSSKWDCAASVSVGGGQLGLGMEMCQKSQAGAPVFTTPTPRGWVLLGQSGSGYSSGQTGRHYGYLQGSGASPEMQTSEFQSASSPRDLLVVVQ